MALSRDFATGFYHSVRWKSTRDAYMRATVDVDGRPCPPGMCERCFSRGLLVPAAIVHHVEWLSPDNISDPGVSLSFGNLERLCRKCHADVHGTVPDGRVAFDADGNVVRRDGHGT